MDMPPHQEIERSNNIHDEIFNNDSDYEAIAEDIAGSRPTPSSYLQPQGYGMIFDVLQESS
jgi:hypothetical protein